MFLKCEKRVARHRGLPSRLLGWLTGEPLLACHANCGAVILVRTIWTSFVLLCVAVALLNVLDPDRLWVFDLKQAQRDLVMHDTWLGAFFAGSYVAFYTRFASQWAYLADLYNKIKAAECSLSADRTTVLASWKAAFIEDCEAVHLARKPIFAAIIVAWSSESAVREAFEGDGVDEPWRAQWLTQLVADAKSELQRVRPD
jgi:hypothetical protein